MALSGQHIENIALHLAKQYSEYTELEKYQIFKLASKRAAPSFWKEDDPRSVQDLDDLFWKGLKTNLEKGEAISLKLYSDLKERDEAKEIAKDINIHIEHDDISDLVLREAVHGTGVDFGRLAQGIEEAEAVPYSPPG